MSVTITVEIEYGEDWCFCDEYEVGAESFEAYDEGKSYGPPEDCYPPEGGTAEVGEIRVKYHGSNEWKEIRGNKGYKDFIKRYAEYSEQDVDKAEEDLCEQLYEACCDYHQGMYDGHWDNVRKERLEEGW